MECAKIKVSAPVLWLLLPTMLCSVLSCGANLAPGSPAPPHGTIKPSSVAADEFEKNVRNQLFDPAKTAFRLTVSDDLADFLTIPAYDELLQLEQGEQS